MKVRAKFVSVFELGSEKPGRLLVSILVAKPHYLVQELAGFPATIEFRIDNTSDLVFRFTLNFD